MSNEPTPLEQFLKKIQASLGAEAINQSTQCCSQWQKATFATDTNVLAVITPNSYEQLKQLILKANEHSITVYPISGGKNWGYGSRVPEVNAVAINLQALTAINHYDQHAGTITLEPGVTFGQLQQFLKQENQGWSFNGPGSSIDASVIGNTLERGLNQGVQMEHWQSVIAMDVLLPNGDSVTVGSENNDPEKSAAGYRASTLPPGPDLRGLFLQSNLGIVTSMTLALDRLPANWQHLHLNWFESVHSFNRVVDVLCGLKRDGLFSSGVAIHNLEKILTLLKQYPYAEAQGKLPLPDKLKTQWSHELEGEWFAETAISAPTAAILSAIKNEVSQRLAEAGLSYHWADANQLGPFFHMLTNPSAEQLYWRKAGSLSENINPEQDSCGVLWLVPTLPWRGDSLQAFFQKISDVIYAAGFEPLISFQCPNHRYVYAAISLIYDREHPGQDHAALELYRQLQTVIHKQGYTLYRHGWLEHTMFEHKRALSDQPCDLDEQKKLQQKIKAILDPQNILAPGHYIPTQTHSIDY